MNGLGELRSTQLTWIQPKCGVDHFVLRVGERRLGEIYWRKWFSDEAVARLGQQSWLFDRIGFFRDRAIATLLDTQNEVAQVTFDWMKDGLVTLANGQTFEWFRTKALGEAWALVDEDERPLYELEFGMHWFKYSVEVSLKREAFRRPEGGLLLCLGMYLGYVTMLDNAAAVAGVAAVTSAAV
jgi:hypothetical protein